MAYDFATGTLFLHVAKNAGTAIQISRGTPWCNPHINHAFKDEWLEKVKPERIFAVYRDPVERFKSAYSYILWKGCQTLPEEHVKDYQSIVEGNVQTLLDRMDDGYWSPFPVLWPQRWWGIWDKDVDVLRFSHIDQDYAAYVSDHNLPCRPLQKINSTTYPKPDLTQAQVKQVMSLHQQDLHPPEFYVSQI